MSAKRITPAVLVVVFVIAALAIASFTPWSTSPKANGLLGLAASNSNRSPLVHGPGAPASTHPYAHVLAYPYKFPGPGR